MKYLKLLLAISLFALWRPPLAAVSGAHRFQVSRACLSFIDVYTVSLLVITTYLITSNMLPIPTVDDFVHRHHRCY